jgi:transcriptional regulator with XRE-family HTH domain
MLLDIVGCGITMRLRGEPMAKRQAQAMDEPLHLVSQLREAIRESGLSLNELGRRTRVSEGQLSRFLRGDRTLTLPAAARLCDYLGMELCRQRKTGRERPAAERQAPDR